MTVSQFEPGAKVELTVVRNNEQKDLTITVGSLSESAMAPSEAAGKAGLEVQQITPDIAKQLGINAKEGVMVSKVSRNSVAEKAGIRPGMVILSVNRQRINSSRNSTRR